ncbi:MAG: ChbG/HpnK family deacetylase [Nitrospirae bacterium]|nr:ChbG/HpnK family deacetylase [Nitrospirota bacterium]
MLPRSKILIVNADDFGIARPVNEGILRCFRQGIVTSASVLSNGSGFDDAAAAALSEKLNVGIHLTLMDGSPLSDAGKVQSLTDGRGFFLRDYASFSLRYFRGGISLPEAEREFRAQIEKFLSAGLKPSHINGHNHVHIFPGLADIVIKLMKEYGIKTVRMPDASMSGALKNPSVNSLAKLILISLARRAKKKVLANGLFAPDHFEGLFSSGRLFKSEILSVLDRLKPGVTELMCHPGLDDRELALAHPWGYGWGKETEALCDSEVKKRAAELGIRLTGF